MNHHALEGNGAKSAPKLDEQKHGGQGKDSEGNLRKRNQCSPWVGGDILAMREYPAIKNSHS